MKKYIIPIILLVALIYQTYNLSKLEETSASNIEVLTGDLASYKTKYDEVVASKKSVILTNNNLNFVNDSLKDVIDNFKKPEVIIKYKWKVKFKTDTLYIPLIASEYPGEFKFKYSDMWAELSGTVNQTHVAFNNPKIINEQSIVSGYKKKNIFAKKQYYVDIKNSNPYIQSVEMNSFKVETKKSAHEKWWITVPVGIAAGFILAN